MPVVVELSWQTITAVASVCTAIGVIIGVIASAVRFVDRQKDQDTEIHSLEETHNKDIKALTESLEVRFSEISEEQRILTSGMLACLRGLQEQGCNGPVTAGIKEIETHINDKAHAPRKGGTF